MTKPLLEALLSFTLLKITLEVAYIYFVADDFAYQGFYVDVDALNYIVIWTVYFTLIISIHFCTGFCYFFIFVFLFSVTTPTFILFAMDQARSSLVIWYLVFFHFGFVIFTGVLKKINLNLSSTKKSPQLIILTCCIASVLTLVIYYFSGARLNFNFENVYEYRRENSFQISGGILSYFMLWSMKVFNVFLLIYFLYKKKYIWFSVAMVIQILMFAYSAHKSIIILPILAILVFLYLKDNRNLSRYLRLVCLILIGTLLFSIYYDSIFASSMLIRRAFFIPAHLNYLYFDFFSVNEKIYWSNSIFGSFISYPYEDKVSRIIGGFWVRDDLSANNGFFALGYAHSGWVGVFLYCLIISLICVLIDRIQKHRHQYRFAIAFMLIPILSVIVSSDLLTSLLTHGLGLAILILFMVDTKMEYKY